MLVFGGRGNDQGVVYALDLNTMKWNCLNNMKFERFNHTANRIGNSIYLFGGFGRKYLWDNYQDIHKYDIKE